MPVLKLKTDAALDDSRCAALAERLTRITAQTLGKRAEVTMVLVEPLPARHGFVAGRGSEQPLALLEIDITAGTNTAEQKSEFIATTRSELCSQLAPGTGLNEASYVVVRELPATDWGYGGRTQQARRVAAGAKVELRGLQQVPNVTPRSRK